MTRRQTRYAELAQLDALDATTWPPRINQAIEQLGHAQSALRARAYDTTRTGDTNQPGLTEEMIHAAHLDKELRHNILERDRLARGIRRILDEWAPQPVKGGMGDTHNAALWCPNHLTHGYREPSGENRTRHCRWCSDVHRTWGRWPTLALIKAHLEGRRISEPEYRRLLGKGVA